MRILLVLKNDKLKTPLSMAIKEIKPDVQFISVRDCDAAKAELEKESVITYLFVQHGYQIKELLQVIEAAKLFNRGQKARIILVVPEGESHEELLSKHLSMGFSGMLVEPFSFDAIKDVMNLSETLTMAGSVARLTVATGLQIKAHLVGQKKMSTGGNVLESVKQACQIFEKENPGQTVQGVAKDISSLSLEDRMKVNIKHIYTGVSKRVKDLVQKKSSKDY